MIELIKHERGVYRITEKEGTSFLERFDGTGWTLVRRAIASDLTLYAKRKGSIND